VLVIGAGGGGAQVLDVLGRLPDLRPIGLLDNNQALVGQAVLDVPILGPVSDLARLWTDRVFDQAVVAIVADREYRQRVFEDGVALGVPFPNLIDPSAVVGAGATLGQGNVLRPFVQIAACCTVGNNNYLAEFTSLGHHSQLGSHCTFASRVATSGWVSIGDRASFGVGACVDGHRRVGAGVVVGPGAVVLEDLVGP
jgi:sugar O-acyltransferase (sialic acid O-acetyltransferase NeuD family)